MSADEPQAADIYTRLPPDLVNVDATAFIRITNNADAEVVRRCVIQYLWPDGRLPTGKIPSSEIVDTARGGSPPELDGIELAGVERVERLSAHVDFGYHHLSFLLHPSAASPERRLVIIHQGHQGGLIDGIAGLANRLLKAGFTVLLMQMPFTGWNTQRTFTTAKGTVRIRERSSTSAHNELFSALGDEGGSPLRFFIEPVTTAINYFIRQHPCYRDISMVGLSGGGWTTHIAAAIDPRIRLSIPVAGSYPLFLRPHYPGSTGDMEQTLPALYEERAGWLDLYILGGEGQGRRQIQLLNQYDTCCFYGVGSDTYKDAVSRVAGIVGGQWECILDSTHRSHQISLWAIENVIMPAMG
jgi:hypothetical protein